MRALRLKLIGTLILTVLLSALPAALIARALFRLSLDPLLETSIVEGAEAGLASTRDLLEAEKRALTATAIAGGRLDTLTAAELAGLDPREQSALVAWARAAREDGGDGSSVEILLEPRRLPLGGRDHLVAYVKSAAGSPEWVIAPVSEGLAARAEKLSDSVRLVRALRRQRDTVMRSLVSSFLVAYGIVVGIVLLTGLALASRLTRPLAALGNGIERVASGDLTTRVPVAAGGEIARLLTSFNQMVERLGSQRAELARLERLAAWRQMAQRLAHEIKNPLTPIQLAAQELRDRVGTDPDSFAQLVGESTAIIEEEVQGLRTLVAEFSQFARLPEPQMTEVDVDELMADVAGLYGGERIRVVLDPAGSGEPAATPRLAWCDRDQIRRVLLNLVDNALAAQAESGNREPVMLAALPGERGAAIALQVADRGPGVALAERERIFEPDVTSKRGGMGLGLAIVLSTVQAHNGTVSVGDRPGGGALFTITLPQLPPAARRQEEVRAAAAPAGDDGPRRGRWSQGR